MSSRQQTVSPPAAGPAAASIAELPAQFFQESVGGSVGTLTTTFGLTPGMTRSAFSRGYSVIMGDSGHDSIVNNDASAGSASAFARDPQARVDFGHASYDLVARVGKALSLAYYGKASSHAYFSACSDGGRQAVGIAQHYPQHFDGILAAAPAVDIPHMTAYVPLILQTLAPLAVAGGHVDAAGRPLIRPRRLRTSCRRSRRLRRPARGLRPRARAARRIAGRRLRPAARPGRLTDHPTPGQELLDALIATTFVDAVG